MEYLLILLFILIVTILLEKIFHIHLYKSRKERFFIVLLFFVYGVVWDSFAIWRQHWDFPPGRTLGIRIGFMPIEEYLFTLIIPYNIITIYKVMDTKFFKKK